MEPEHACLLALIGMVMDLTLAAFKVRLRA